MKIEVFFLSPLLCYWCSVTQSCPTLCNHMDHSRRGLTVPHHLPEFSQVHKRGSLPSIWFPQYTHSPRLFHQDSLLMIQKLISPARPHSLFSVVHRTSLCWCSKDTICWFAISCKSKMFKIFILAYAILKSMKWYLIVIYISFMVSDTEHFFIYSLGICLSSLQKLICGNEQWGTWIFLNIFSCLSCYCDNQLVFCVSLCNIRKQ